MSDVDFRENNEGSNEMSSAKKQKKERFTFSDGMKKKEKQEHKRGEGKINVKA